MSWFVRNENWRTYIRRYPITSLLMAINIIVFLFMTFGGGSTDFVTLIQYGAYFKPAILEGGEYFRFLTPIFIHIGWEHLLFNNFAILIFAPGLEIMLRKFRYLLLYLASGASGFILTFLFSGPEVIAAGASGSIFGIYGMYAYLARYRRDLMDTYSRQTILPILIFGVISTFVIPGISILGHIGGLVTGYSLGFFLVKRRPVYY
ncbi:rhomboid family intramembrane serine protease [Ammoniphilus resinae]|uniref:Membrane associated rhomboid family serine protease n=1 Tax=Ammoniphilus resinae TaxID=861532 RepID=A0ABS4GU19_9BACL|nr:rhomboid family intramembrane serine protease [Ammoniphilus resinae]MBP1933765.1 membrane associated rhomboid family serine protease [Ammoniphilus resinae]